MKNNNSNIDNNIKNRKLEHKDENLSSARLFYPKRNHIVKKPFGNTLTSFTFCLRLTTCKVKKGLLWIHVQFEEQSLLMCSRRIRI